MTRAEWEAKHRQYHPYQCKRFGHRKLAAAGPCSVCATLKPAATLRPRRKRVA